MAGKDWLDLMLRVKDIVDALVFYHAYAKSGDTVSPGFDGWVSYRCPINRDHANEDNKPSFSICIQETGKYQPGAWKCRAGCGGGGGDFASLIELVNGIPKGQGVVVIARDFQTGWIAERGSQAAKLQKEKPPEALPDIEDLRVHFNRLYEEGNQTAADFLAYLRGKRFLTDKVLTDAFIGTLGTDILFPVFDEKHKVLNLREHRPSGKPKMRGKGGRGAQLYPLWIFDQNRAPIITEGEIDALTFHCMGENGITCTGGIDTLQLARYEPILRHKDDMLPLVVVCVDTETKSRKRAIRFANECLTAGVFTVKIVDLPEGVKDINAWIQLLGGDYEQLKKGWLRILEEANPLTKDSVMFGLVPSKGCLVKITGPVEEVVCKFLGRIISSGRVHDAAGETSVSRYFLKLKHQDGSKLKVEHDDGKFFNRSVMASAKGVGKWRILEREADKVFSWICLNSPDQKTRDVGWIVGYQDEKISGDYMTKSAIFKRDGTVVPNEEFDMIAPQSFKNLDLPVPNVLEVEAAADLMFKDLIGMHDCVSSMQILCAALLAPLRRGMELLFQEEPMFTVFIHGRTGTGKSQLALAAQSLFGMNREDGMLSFDSTIKSLQLRAAAAGDTMVVLDEFPLSASKQQTGHLLAFLKNAQTEGRGTLRSDRSENVVPTINGLLTVTSERLPTDDPGQLARALVINLRRGPSPSEKLCFKRLRDNVSKLPQAMSGWLSWMFKQEHIGALRGEATQKSAESYVAAALAEAVPDGIVVQNRNRFERRANTLTAIWLHAITWGRAIGVLSSDKADKLEGAWIEDVLPNLFQVNLSIQASSSLPEDFVTALVAALQSGSAKLIGAKGMILEIPSRDVAHPNALVIGYVCPDEDGTSYDGRNVRVFLTNAANEVYRPGERGMWRGTIDALKPEWLMEVEDANRHRIGPQRIRGHPGTNLLTTELLSPFSSQQQRSMASGTMIHLHEPTDPDQRRESQ